MKKLISILAVLLIICTGLTSCGPTAVVVKPRPNVVYVRPVRPAPNYIWVEPVRIRRGHYRAGYWAVPRRY